MNKKVVSVMMLCASLFTLSATAQNPNARRQTCPQTQCPVEATCDNPGQQCAEAPAQCCTVLFEGITLTDAQKAKIQDLQKTCAANRKAQVCESREAAKAERCKIRQERDAARKAQKRAYLDGMKQVLTPDQYVIFLENAYMTPAPQGPRMGAPGRQHHGMKPGKVAARKDGKAVAMSRDRKDGKIAKSKVTEAKVAKVNAAE